MRPLNKTKIYKNGSIEVRRENVDCWIKFDDLPKVHIWDPNNRYGYYVYRGTALGENTVEEKMSVINQELNSYMKIRGTRTSWTRNDSWLKAWKAKKENDEWVK